LETSRLDAADAAALAEASLHDLATQLETARLHAIDAAAAGDAAIKDQEAQLDKFKAQHEISTQAQIAALEAEQKAATDAVQARLTALKVEYEAQSQAQMSVIKAEHEAQMAALKVEHKAQIAALKVDYEAQSQAQLTALTTEMKARMVAMTAEHEASPENAKLVDKIEMLKVLAKARRREMVTTKCCMGILLQVQHRADELARYHASMWGLGALQNGLYAHKLSTLQAIVAKQEVQLGSLQHKNQHPHSEIRKLQG